MNTNSSPLEYLAAFAIAFVAGMLSSVALSAMNHAKRKQTPQNARN